MCKIIFFNWYFARGLQRGINDNAKLHLINENKANKVDKPIQLFDLESVNWN